MEECSRRVVRGNASVAQRIQEDFVNTVVCRDHFRKYEQKAMIGRPVYRIWLNKKFLWEFLMLASLPSVNR